MKIAAMLSLFLLVSLVGTRFSCAALQVERVNSPELEEAGKLSRQVLSLFAEKKFEEALGLAKQALEIREKILGRDHEEVASSLDSIADIYSGQVIVEVKVDECGRVIDARALKGHVQLVEGAIKAARQWQFTPTRLAGRPVKVIGTITFNFHI